jgi:hypothetical protein
MALVVVEYGWYGCVLFVVVVDVDVDVYEQNNTALKKT